MYLSLQQRLAGAHTVSEALQVLLCVREPFLRLDVKGANGSGSVWVRGGQQIVAAMTITGKRDYQGLLYILALKQPTFAVDLQVGEPSDWPMEVSVQRLICEQDGLLDSIRGAVRTVEIMAPHAGVSRLPHQVAVEADDLTPNMPIPRYSLTDDDLALRRAEDIERSALLVAKRPLTPAPDEIMHVLEPQLDSLEQQRVLDLMAGVAGELTFAPPEPPESGKELLFLAAAERTRWTSDLKSEQVFNLETNPEEVERTLTMAVPVIQSPAGGGTWQSEHIRSRIASFRRAVPIELVAAVVVSTGCALGVYAFHGNEQQQTSREDAASVSAFADEIVDSESSATQSPQPFRTAAAPVVATPPPTSWQSSSESDKADEELAKKADGRPLRSRPDKQDKKVQAESSAGNGAWTYSSVQQQQIREKMNVADQLSAAGKFSEAAGLYASAVEQFPRHMQLRINAIRAFMRIRQRAQAKQLCEDGMKNAASDSDRFIFKNLLSNL